MDGSACFSQSLINPNPFSAVGMANKLGAKHNFTVIAFTGMPGAGKSEAVLIAKEMGYPVFRIGDCVMEEVKSRGLPLDDKNVGSIATEMRRKFGFDIWAKRTYEKICDAFFENREPRTENGEPRIEGRVASIEGTSLMPQSSSLTTHPSYLPQSRVANYESQIPKCIIIDGVRNIEEADFFKSVFPIFKLVAIDAPFEVRCERLINRGRSDAPQNPEECKKRDERELSWGLGKLIEKADIRIENAGTLNDFRRMFREAFEEMA